MLLLTATTDKLQLVTSAAATLDVHASWADNAAGTITYGRTNTPITTATTTDIVAAPGASTARNVRAMHIRNKHATLSCNVTVIFNQNATLFELHATTIKAGEMLSYVEGIGFFLYTIGSLLTTTYSTVDQAIAAATNAYLTGSALIIPAGRPIAIGTSFRWRVVLVKTAAGTGAPVFDIRFGTGGSTSDTARITFTSPYAQTNVVDTAQVTIEAIVRGPIGASCIVQASFELEHNLQITGFATVPTVVMSVASAAFDITTAGMIVGLAHNTGTGNVITVPMVAGQILNL